MGGGKGSGTEGGDINRCGGVKVWQRRGRCGGGGML